VCAREISVISGRLDRFGRTEQVVHLRVSQA